MLLFLKLGLKHLVPSCQHRTALCCRGGTGSLTAPLQALEPEWWEPKAEENLRDLQKITKLTDCVEWATNMKSSTCFIITGPCWCFQKIKKPWRASQFFLGEQNIPCPISRFKIMRVEKCQLHLITQKHSDAFPYSCPYSCFTWQSYVLCNSPAGSTRKTTTKKDSLTSNKRDHCNMLHIYFFAQQVTICTTNCIC